MMDFRFNFFMVFFSFKEKIFPIMLFLSVFSLIPELNAQERFYDSDLGGYVVGDIPEEFNSREIVHNDVLDNIDDLLEEDTVRENEDSILPERLELKGQVRNEFAHRIKDPREITKIRNEVILSQELELLDNVTIKSKQRYFYDSVFDVNDYFSTTVSRNMRDLQELRELVADIQLGSLDLRIGKQQIVWGEIIGTFVADTINAKDLREFILQDLDRIRIPEWAIDALYTQGDTTMQLVWLPFPRMNRLPVQGSEFAFAFPETNFRPVGFRDPERPSNSLSNSELGGRVLYNLEGVELSAFYFYGWDKTPLLRSVRTDRGLILDQDYERRHSGGFSFSKAYNSVVLKGEAIFTPGSKQQLSSFRNENAIVEKDVLEYALGADFILEDQWRLNFQFLQRVIMGEKVDLLTQDKRIRNLGSVWINKKFFDDFLEPEFFILSDLEESNAMLRPKISIYPNSYSQITLGGDIFLGDEDLLFGQFQDKSRVYSEVTLFF